MTFNASNPPPLPIDSIVRCIHPVNGLDYDRLYRVVDRPADDIHECVIVETMTGHRPSAVGYFAAGFELCREF